MIYHSRLRKKSEGIVTARRWAIGIITTLLGAGMIASEVSRVRAEWPNVMVVSYVALFALTGVLVWLWIWATDHELKILWRWLDPDRYKPPQSFREVALIASLAVVLSSLFFASRDPLFYAIAFCVYNLATLLSNRYLDKQIDRALGKSRQRLKAEVVANPNDKRLPFYESGMDVVEHYFRRRPQRFRHVLILIFGGLALSLAIAYRQTGRTALGVGSYGIAFFTIVVSEAVIAVWRNSRDDTLGPIEEEVDELERAMAEERRARLSAPSKP